MHAASAEANDLGRFPEDFIGIADSSHGATYELRADVALLAQRVIRLVVKRHLAKDSGLLRHGHSEVADAGVFEADLLQRGALFRSGPKFYADGADTHNLGFLAYPTAIGNPKLYAATRRAHPLLSKEEAIIR